MKYLFLVSGENPEVGFFEIKSVLEAFEIEHRIIYSSEKERILIIESSKIDNNILDRLAFTKKAYTYLGGGFLDNYPKILSHIDWESVITGSFYVNTIRIPKSNKKLSGFRIKLSDYIWDSLKNPKVSVRKPDNIIEAIITNENLFIGKLVYERNYKEFLNRNPEKRPYFHPTSLTPKNARLLINLSKVSNGVLLDPFCGYGGIVIEACLMGIKILCSDISEEAIEATKGNLQYYCKNYEKYVHIFQSDVYDIKDHVKDVKAIATDPPYGFGSRIYSNKSLEEFYLDFLNIFYELLGKNSRVSMFIPKYLDIVKILDELEFELLFLKDVNWDNNKNRRLLVLKK